jgi:hypothetical protein
MWCGLTVKICVPPLERKRRLRPVVPRRGSRLLYVDPVGGR